MPSSKRRLSEILKEDDREKDETVVEDEEEEDEDGGQEGDDEEEEEGGQEGDDEEEEEEDQGEEEEEDDKQVREEEEDSGSESDSKSAFRVEPIVSTERPKKRKKHFVAANADQEEEEEQKQVTPEKVKQQSKPFQRVWSEDDEISVLRGMIDFINKGRGDPCKDAAVFRDFVKKSLHYQPDQNQLKEKIRRLKKKFENNAKKGTGGKDPVISKPHELQSYDLSKQIWGNTTQTVSTKRSKKNPKANNEKNPPEVFQGNTNSNNENKHVQVGTDDGISFLSSCFHKSSTPQLPHGLDVKRMLATAGTSKANEIEQRWKKLFLAEMKLYVERLDLIKEQSQLILEAMESS